MHASGLQQALAEVKTLAKAKAMVALVEAESSVPDEISTAAEVIC